MELQNGGMEMINGGNLYRSDRVSDEYLLVNNCGYQATGSVDTTTVRPRGRSDYQLLYVWHGRLVLREGGEEISAPDFSSQYPSVDDYLREYGDKVNELHELAAQLAHIMNPAAAERWEDEVQAAASAPAAAAPAAADPVAEIQKYKLLFDAGVITEEEFAAKKKQLLGI